MTQIPIERDRMKANPGVGREFGTLGIEVLLEPRAILE